MEPNLFRIAEHQTVERILNAFIRERGSRLTFAESDETLIRWANAQDPQARWMSLSLPKRQVKLLGKMTYRSVFDHHHYGERFWVAGADQRVTPVTATQVIRWILEELAEGEESGPVEALLSQIQNSIEKTALYLERALTQGVRDGLDLNPEARLRWMEQRLLYGHPFHPTPKSSEGFSTEDLRRFAPELQAAFPLHFFAVHPDWMEEDWTGDVALPNERVVSAEVAAASHGAIPKGYRLLPMHPWQAAYVRRFQAWQAGMEQGKIIDLNQMGPDVFPTSSVRTVWGARYPYSFKLPLHVRITHFVRENTTEQVKRSIDASRVVRELRKAWPYPSMSILAEVGALRFHPPAGIDDAYPLASSNVLLRENPDLTGGQVPLVVASLLECWPNQSEPPLFQAIRQAVQLPHGPIPARKLADWLRKYVEVVFIPALALFADEGVSLEAHVQNSLIHLEQGWPAHFYVRDMEGVSINRELAKAKGYYHGAISPDSPVLYSEEKAWERLQYYLITNHLGHLLHVLAYYGEWSEQEAWAVVRGQLDKQKAVGSVQLSRVIDQLLGASALRAKANLISRFQNRGDSAIYLDLPNPMKGEVKAE
ncbi:IucA/IucC family protein [Laceyella putida]|uniref:IucA/IucC family protein n=1 Tax=Laceyella putida TaxID=110101 RepID=A0ABW2RFJ9_9BACL